MDRSRSLLALIDFQSRLMPAMDDGEAALRNARRLVDAARLFSVPVVVTEQNPRGLGPTVPALGLQNPPPGASEDPATGPLLIHKMAFSACAAPGFMTRIGEKPDIVLAGCESHICVLQTALGLIEAGRRVFVVEDAVASRRARSRQVALDRMASAGGVIVTTEMVVFEWARTYEDPQFRAASALIR